MELSLLYVAAFLLITIRISLAFLLSHISHCISWR